MVDALFLVAMQEEAAKARKAELNSKSQQDLKELVSRCGLESGTKDQNIKAILSHETKVREDLKAFESRIGEVSEQYEEELDKKTNAALKDMCADKGLALGGG